MRRDFLAILLALALALLHLGLALSYAAVAPFLKEGVTNGQRLPDIGAPDERAHVGYVAHLMAGRGLPVLRPGTTDFNDTYESHQPPLAYAAYAGWSRLIGYDDPRKAGSYLRTLSALMGAGTVLLTFALVVWAGVGRRVALLAAAFVALLPMHAALSGAVSNDPLTLLLCTAVLALVARQREGWSAGTAALAGMLIGLTILTKATGLLLLPVVAVAWWVTPGRKPLHLALLLGVPLLLSAPWFIRNQELYGHPMAMNVFYASFARHVDPAELLSSPRALARWLYVLGAGTALSFVGIFGYMDIHLPNWIYFPLLAVLGLALFYGWRARSPRVWAYLLFSALIVASYVGYNLWQVQPQARYLFPAIALIGLTMARGVRDRTWLAALMIGGLLLANGVALSILPGAFEERVRAAEGP